MKRTGGARTLRITTPGRVRNPYARRILSNLKGRNTMSVFASGPRNLERAVRGLSEREMRRPPAPGRWPIAWLVHHLCDTEVGLGFRLRQVLARSGVRFQTFDQDRWAAALHYGRRTVARSLELFGALRRVHVELVRTASSAELRRFGMHPERGRETAGRIVQLLAGHDINHLRQIRAIRAGFRRR